MTTIQRQFILDATGTPIGVILPLEEFALVKDILERAVTPLVMSEEQEKLQLLEQAASDPLFLADMNEVMSAFTIVDRSGGSRLRDIPVAANKSSKPSNFNWTCKDH